MALQELKIWAKTLNNDMLTLTDQRRDIEDEEFLDGWLRTSPASSQQMNQLFYLLTTYANPFPNAPVIYPSALDIPSVALEMNGQTITEEDYPNAFAIYGGTLPNITASAPTGFTYIIRGS